jgi:hypothetical protein
MRRAAEAALERLKVISENSAGTERHQASLRVVDDEQLNELLDPLRRSAPRKVVCGKCRRKVLFLGLRTRTAMVIFQTHGPTPMTGHGQRDRDGALLPEPFDRWSISPIWGGVVDPAPADSGVPPGEALRFRFACRNPKCQAQYTLTNTTMLQRLVRSIADGDKQIRL